MTASGSPFQDLFEAEREEIRKADAGVGSEPWGVRGLLYEYDALEARWLGMRDAYDREVLRAGRAEAAIREALAHCRRERFLDAERVLREAAGE